MINTRFCAGCCDICDKKDVSEHGYCEAYEYEYSARQDELTGGNDE